MSIWIWRLDQLLGRLACLVERHNWRTVSKPCRFHGFPCTRDVTHCTRCPAVR